MRLTTIDVGTNTILMLVADVASDGTLSIVRDDQVIPRLGRGIDKHRRITEETFERILGYLQKYKEIADSLKPDGIIICGTSALRDATNSEEFIEYIRVRLGLSIKILSGEEEADLTYRGAVSEFLHEGTQESFAVLDIGGGSTELSLGRGFSVTQKMSLDIGSVRLTERILHSSPPRPEDISHAFGEVRKLVSRLQELPPGSRLLGVAGTVTTLAAIDLRLTLYDPKLVSGHFLSYDKIDRIYNDLRNQSATEMMNSYPLIQPGRADIILAGIIILMESLKRLNSEGITASDRGLRHGIALREFSRRSTKN